MLSEKFPESLAQISLLAFLILPMLVKSSLLTVFGTVHFFSSVASVGATRKETPVDACVALCSLYPGIKCYGVHDHDGKCEKMYMDEKGAIHISDAPKSEWKSVTTAHAKSTVFVSAEKCTEICQQTSGCGSSYCKDNGYCHGLFWDSFHARSACYQTENTPCKEATPISCVIEAKIVASKPEIANETGTVSKDAAGDENNTRSTGSEQPTETVEESSAPRQVTSTEAHNGNVLTPPQAPETGAKSSGVKVEAADKSVVDAKSNEAGPAKSSRFPTGVMTTLAVMVCGYIIM